MNSIGGLSNKKSSRRWSNGVILGGGPVDLKQKAFVLKTVLMHMACVRESVRTRETGHDINIHIKICIFYMNVCE